MNGKASHILIVLIAIAALANSAESYSFSSSHSSSNATSTADPHVLIVGGRTLGDRCVYKEHIVKDSSWFRIVTHEQTYNISQYERITQVRAVDKSTDGNGAIPSLRAGGPGHSFVTLRMKSQRNHGIDFDIEIYAKP